MVQRRKKKQDCAFTNSTAISTYVKAGMYFNDFPLQITRR